MSLEADHRAHFRETVLGAGYCVEHGDACAYEIQDAHHVIRRQIIRRKLPLYTSKEEILAVCFDPRVGVRVCRPFHDRLDASVNRLYLQPEQVPWQAVTFCQDNGLIPELVAAVPDIDVA